MLRRHVDRLVAFFFLALRRAGVHAESATGAVIGSDLDASLLFRIFLTLPVHDGEGFGSVFELLRIDRLHTDGRMRTDQRAKATLNAERAIPDRNVLGNTSLFVLRRGSGEGTVDRQGRDGQLVATVGDDRAEHFFDELGSVALGTRVTGFGGGDRTGHFQLVESVDGTVNRGEVARDDLASTLFAVGLFNGRLDRGDRFVLGQHVGELEEAGLHDGVDTHAHFGLMEPRRRRRSRRPSASCR